MIMFVDVASFVSKWRLSIDIGENAVIIICIFCKTYINQSPIVPTETETWTHTHTKMNIKLMFLAIHFNQ